MKTTRTPFAMKNALIAIAVIFAIIVGLNSFTIVDSTKTKVQICFGEVTDNKIFEEGIHLVNPLCSFDTFNTAEQKYEVSGLSIPTQDRFNSSANVTALFRISPAKVIDIRKNFGNETTFIETSLRQHLRSIVRDEGRKLRDSRDLGQSTSVSNMQDSSTTRLSEAVIDAGMNISQVLVQDIEFDSRIATQILDAQRRIQREESEASQTRIATQIANQKIEAQKGISESNKLITDATAYNTREKSDAEAYDTRQKAEAKRFSIEQVAIANMKLTKSLTPEILEKARLDNEALLFSRSKGNVPTTVIGSTDLRAYGVPLHSIK